MTTKIRLVESGVVLSENDGSSQWDPNWVDFVSGKHTEPGYDPLATGYVHTIISNIANAQNMTEEQITDLLRNGAEFTY